MKALIVSLALVCSATALGQPATKGEKLSPAQDGPAIDLLSIDKQGKLLEQRILQSGGSPAHLGRGAATVAEKKDAMRAYVTQSCCRQLG